MSLITLFRSNCTWEIYAGSKGINIVVSLLVDLSEEKVIDGTTRLDLSWSIYPYHLNYGLSWHYQSILSLSRIPPGSLHSSVDLQDPRYILKYYLIIYLLSYVV